MSMPPPPNDPFAQQPGSPFPPRPGGFQPYPAGAPVPGKQRNSGMAVASLTCSLVGLIPCFWLFQIMGLLGAIFGFVGLKQTKSGERGGRSMAVAGVIVGIILVVACVGFWIYFAANADCVFNDGRWECTTT